MYKRDRALTTYSALNTDYNIETCIKPLTELVIQKEFIIVLAPTYSFNVFAIDDIWSKLAQNEPVQNGPQFLIRHETYSKLLSSCPTFGIYVL